MMAGYYSWEYSGSKYVCSTGGTVTVGGSASEAGWISVVRPDGTSYQEYVDIGPYTVSYTEQSCEWVDSYTGTWHSTSGDGGDPPPPEGGGGSGGGGGSPPPPTPPADTCPNAGDTLGPLQIRSLQDSLGVALTDAIAADHELAGWIARHPSTGRWYFVRGQMDMNATDNCNYKLLPQSLPGEQVAFWHTHLYADGTTVFCRLRGELVTINNIALGGGSVSSGTYLGDWDAVRDTTMGGPMYTIDPNTIYRLDPDRPVGHEGNNPNVWIRVAGSCAIRSLQ
jgi:hypothetical protein